MSKRAFICVSGRQASSLLLGNALFVVGLTGSAQQCQHLSTLSVDLSSRPSTSGPSLPPSLRELQETLRTPHSVVISTLDEQLRLKQGKVSPSGGAVDGDLDDGVSCLLLRANSLTRANLDTLRMLQRHNGGISVLRGQTILAKVLNVDGKRVLVDTGFTGLSEVPRNDITIAHIYTADGQLPARLSTSDIRPGDLLRLRVECMYTPYGDMQLSAVEGDTEQQRRTIWSELQRRMEQQRPVSGRVLNECPGGFAVGIAGFVAFLPAALAATSTSRLVGVRQEFQIIAMESARRRITLRDPKLQRVKR